MPHLNLCRLDLSGLSKESVQVSKNAVRTMFNLPARKNSTTKTRSRTLQLRHRIVIYYSLITIVALQTIFYWDEVSKNSYRSTDVRDSYGEGIFGSVIIFAIGFSLVWWLTRYRFSEPKILFKFGPLSVTLGWLVIMFIISIFFLPISIEANRINDYDNRLDIRIEEDAQRDLDNWLDPEYRANRARRSQAAAEEHFGKQLMKILKSFENFNE